MTQFNNKGFVIKAVNGRLIEDSHVSAYSRRRAVTNARLEPVDGCPGLFVRIAIKELSSVTKAQRQEVHNQARAWYMTVNGEEWITQTDAQLDRHDRLAADVGREVSKSPAQHDDDVGAPSGVTNVTPEDDSAPVDDSDEAAVDEVENNTAAEALVYNVLTIDEVTLEELTEMARALDIPGRSKMDKGELFEAVQQASGVTNVTPEGDEQ